MAQTIIPNDPAGNTTEAIGVFNALHNTTQDHAVSEILKQRLINITKKKHEELAKNMNTILQNYCSGIESDLTYIITEYASTKSHLEYSVKVNSLLKAANEILKKQLEASATNLQQNVKPVQDNTTISSLQLELDIATKELTRAMEDVEKFKIQQSQMEAALHNKDIVNQQLAAIIEGRQVEINQQKKENADLSAKLVEARAHLVRITESTKNNEIKLQPQPQQPQPPHKQQSIQQPQLQQQQQLVQQQQQLPQLLQHQHVIVQQQQQQQQQWRPHFTIPPTATFNGPIMGHFNQTASSPSLPISQRQPVHSPFRPLNNSISPTQQVIISPIPAIMPANTSHSSALPAQSLNNQSTANPTFINPLAQPSTISGISTAALLQQTKNQLDANIAQRLHQDRKIHNLKQQSINNWREKQLKQQMITHFPSNTLQSHNSSQHPNYQQASHLLSNPLPQQPQQLQTQQPQQPQQPQVQQQQSPIFFQSKQNADTAHSTLTSQAGVQRSSPSTALQVPASQSKNETMPSMIAILGTTATSSATASGQTPIASSPAGVSFPLPISGPLSLPAFSGLFSPSTLPSNEGISPKLLELKPTLPISSPSSSPKIASASLTTKSAAMQSASTKESTLQTITVASITTVDSTVPSRPSSLSSDNLISSLKGQISGHRPSKPLIGPASVKKRSYESSLVILSTDDEDDEGDTTEDDEGDTTEDDEGDTTEDDEMYGGTYSHSININSTNSNNDDDIHSQRTLIDFKFDRDGWTSTATSSPVAVSPSKKKQASAEFKKEPGKWYLSHVQIPPYSRTRNSLPETSAGSLQDPSKVILVDDSGTST
ncbi:hypothetical protein FBU30_009078 [Linnemannia zychae]|nr:hypothetical protein FBU30_009078 [Linnemannia zychae]